MKTKPKKSKDTKPKNRIAALKVTEPDPIQEAAKAVVENGRPTTEEDWKARANACGEEIAAVLKKHSIQIIPQIDRQIEPVGETGTAVMIRAVWALAPAP